MTKHNNGESRENAAKKAKTKDNGCDRKGSVI